MITETIVMYTIYDHPTDYPDKFVVRRWFIHPGDPIPRPEANPQLADTLEAARKFVPAGCWNLFTMPFDDPKIAEVWI